jgi:BirA family transcriptional regulator, biotin operon repressor / biotin---[acetyl-CoA-carboxylase] ligase
MQFGQPLYRHEIVTSTQDIAKDLAQTAPPGTTVTAQSMTAGRGRQGRTWVTPFGCNVCLTTIGPPIPVASAWQLSFVVGAAVCEAIRKEFAAYDHLPIPTVRFPNDVYLSGRKVSGVLIETVPARNHPGSAIPLIGIGVNGNVPQEPLPPEIAERAISLDEATGHTWHVPDIETAVLAALTEVWNEWETEGISATLQRWHTLHDANTYRTFYLNGLPHSCRVLTVTSEGEVHIETASGNRFAVSIAHILLGND